MKKIFYICTIGLMMLVGINTAKAYSVSQMEEEGISCFYKDPNGQNYYFKYEGHNKEQQFDIVTNFEELGVAIEVDRPGYSITDSRELKWLIEKGLVNDQLNFTCPEADPFGISDLTLDEMSCNENGCQTGIIPTSYEEYSCNYVGQATGKNITIDYLSNDQYPNGKWRIQYPDGVSQVLVGTQINGNTLPNHDCSDIFYINSSKTIHVANTSDNVLSQLCRNYNINEIEHFCASGYACSEITMTCPIKVTTSLKGCDIKDIPEQLPKYISNLINLIKILVPILLVIMGMLDFVKAVISSDEKQMKESQSRFIRRIFAASIIFFVIAIVQFVFSAIGTDDNILGCVDCFINGDCKTTDQKKSECINEVSKECGNNCYSKIGSYSSQDFYNCVNSCNEKNQNICEK